MAQLLRGHPIPRDTSLPIPYLDLFFCSFSVSGFPIFNFLLNFSLKFSAYKTVLPRA
jgi:hypothetical protein